MLASLLSAPMDWMAPLPLFSFLVAKRKKKEKNKKETSIRRNGISLAMMKRNRRSAIGAVEPSVAEFSLFFQVLLRFT